MRLPKTLLLFVAIMLLLAACGGGAPEDSDDDEETGGQPTQETTLTATTETSETPTERDDALSGETTEPASNDVPVGGELIIGNNADASVLDPHLSTDLYSSRVYNQLFETLIASDFEGNYVPVLATDWEIEEDGRVWVFTLREGVKFHDGEEMTAEDVKFSLERLKDPATASPNRPNFEGIETIETPDDYTVRVTLAEPSGVFISGLGNGYILPQHAVEELGEDFNTNPVGTGPFKFVEWIPDDSISLEVFEDFWDGRANLDRLVFRPIPETSTRIVELETGGIHLAGELPGQELERLETTDGLVVDSVIGTNYRLLGLNTSRAPFDDPLVRQAIAHAIDKQQLIDTVYPGVAVKAEGPLPPTSWAYDESFTGRDFDLETAKELMAQSAHPDGFEATLLISEGDIGQRDAVILQSMLAELNIELSVETLEFGTFLDRVTTQNYDMMRIGWTTTPEPDALLYNVFHSASEQFNFTAYSNAEVDALLDEGRRVTDMEERAEIYRQVQEIVVEEVPMVFLYHERRIVGYDDAIVGFQPHFSGAFNFKTGYGANVGFDQ